jgi:hypothetical protein
MKDMPKTELFNTFAIKGMDLRDYFAAHVMQGLMASQWQTTEPYAEYVYKVADAMMEARNGSQN